MGMIQAEMNEKLRARTNRRRLPRIDDEVCGANLGVPSPRPVQIELPGELAEVGPGPPEDHGVTGEMPARGHSAKSLIVQRVFREFQPSGPATGALPDFSGVS